VRAIAAWMSVLPADSRLWFHARGVAQPGSAPALGAGGPRFKSGRPDIAFVCDCLWLAIEALDLQDVCVPVVCACELDACPRFKFRKSCVERRKAEGIRVCGVRVWGLGVISPLQTGCSADRNGLQAGCTASADRLRRRIDRYDESELEWEMISRIVDVIAPIPLRALVGRETGVLAARAGTRTAYSEIGRPPERGRGHPLIRPGGEVRPIAGACLRRTLGFSSPLARAVQGTRDRTITWRTTPLRQAHRTSTTRTKTAQTARKSRKSTSSRGLARDGTSARSARRNLASAAPEGHLPVRPGQLAVK
jgi:hypothetical protein